MPRITPHGLAITALGVLAVMASAGARAQLLVQGVEGELADNIRAHISLTEEACDAPRWRLVQRRKEVPQQAKVALNAYGYYQPALKASFTETDDCWQLLLDVTPGERVRLRNINVALADRPPALDGELAEMLDHPPLDAGDPLVHQDYDSYKTQLLETARAQGYWRAQFTEAELAIYPHEQAADVKLALVLGPRYYFGDYQFTDVGLTPEFLRRLAGNVQDEPYTSEAVQKIYSRLQGSDYFRRVLLNPHVNTQSDDVTVPVEVDLALQSQTSVSAGVGYSSDQGARVRADYRNRYANPKGHKWRVDGLYSRTFKELGFTYTIPRNDPAREWYEINAGVLSESTVSYDTEAQTTQVRAVEALPYDWVLSSAINLRNETYIIGSEPEETKLLVVPGVGFSWVDAPKDVRQLEGIRFEANLTGSSQYWLSDADFLQVRVKSKIILPFSTRLRLIARAEAATTLKDDITDLPPSVRFFTGGDNSVRGYQYNALGPKNDAGDVVGGSHLVVASAEFDYLFLPNWSVSVFADAGNAFDTVFELKRGVGVGVRWYSPVGPLRFDLARPLDPQDPDDKFRLHLSVGADL
ncbi:autotransporter assembly complex protein TamA [Simiduia sp. 21SJ11W-1]|uniref:autotransporter assembly complex protein TamA n=1 Tax=Simiduia sp. 21SJ11W-1 TaxID=2909669 RepID=UPI00209EBB96|nr:autotransporter assembly complex family protein [Simiduia sp. 21SJ11W-1]UTA48470.1 autotransporter assembly complex protein TamA [Simiduia sp. 21SJ11W-1]